MVIKEEPVQKTPPFNMKYKEDDVNKQIKEKNGIIDGKKVPHKYPQKYEDDSESETDWPSGISDDEKDRLKAKHQRTMEAQYGQSWQGKYLSKKPRFQKGNAMFTSTKDGHLKEWSIKKNSEVFDFGKVHKSAIKGLVVNYDETMQLTSSYDKHIKQFCLVTKHLIRDYGDCADMFIETICFSKCGTFLFSGGDDNIQRQFEFNDNILKLKYEYELDMPPFMLSTAAKTRVFYAVMGYEGHLYRWNIVDSNFPKNNIEQEMEESEQIANIGLGTDSKTGKPINNFNQRKFMHNLKLTGQKYKKHALKTSSLQNSGLQTQSDYSE